MSKPNIDLNSQPVKSDRKTAVDYVLPHNHNAVRIALAYAEQDVQDERLFQLIKYIKDLGGTEAEAAKRMKVHFTLVNRIVKKFSGGDK